MTIDHSVAEERLLDAALLRESGVHKLVVVDHDGNCLAYLLAWDRFEYHCDSDTFVCFAARDGRELMTLFTEGEVQQEAGTNRYVVKAPAVNL